MTDPTGEAGSFDLTGRRAVVTGGGSGIGRAVAEVLVGAGARVAVVSRRPDPPDGTVAVAADLADPDELDEVVDRCVAALGGLDILVNNAGRGDWRRVTDLDRAWFDELVALNLWAPLRLAQLARRHLAESGDGVVVNIGSVDAERPSAGGAVYGATKAGLGAVTVALAKEWADLGIRVVQVDPGLVDTPMATGAVSDLAASGDRINLVGRPGRPAEVAALVHYLVAPAGRFVTGTRIRVDGGALALGPFDVRP